VLVAASPTTKVALMSHHPFTRRSDGAWQPVAIRRRRRWRFMRFFVTGFALSEEPERPAGISRMMWSASGGLLDRLLPAGAQQHAMRERRNGERLDVVGDAIVPPVDQRQSFRGLDQGQRSSRAYPSASAAWVRVACTIAMT